MRFAPQRRSIFPDRNIQNRSRPEVFCPFWLANGLRATAACDFSTSEVQKVAQACGVSCVLTCKWAPRHSCVRCFVRFDLQMRFAPQRCAIIPDRNFKMAPRVRCFVHFDLQMSIRDFPNISRVELLSIYLRVGLLLVRVLARWSSFCWLSFPTLLFNCPYCRELDF